MMITKRQFGVTIVIFVTLLLLFMGFQVGKEAVSSPDLNKHVADETETGRGSRVTPGFAPTDQKGEPEGLSRQDEWILYVGDENSEYAATVKEWSYYSKIPAVPAKELPSESDGVLPDYLMLEADAVEGQSEHIAGLMEKGVNVVFLSLPDYHTVRSDETLRQVLGIYKTVQEQVTLRGVHLFEGFLLGGERIFEETEETKEKKLQDLELNIPWYTVRTGTKTYLRGTLSEEDLHDALERKMKNEDMPAIVWRNHYGNAKAYAVNGHYLKNRRAGMGILHAMLYEQRDYLIYPVINAQVFSVDCFPILTDENKEQVKQVYGRSVNKAQTDILLPMFITLAAKYDIKTSCFLSAKYDREDPAQPQLDVLPTYLSMIDEMDGELALSASTNGNRLSNREMRADFAFLKSEIPNYRMTAVMSSSGELPLLPDALKEANAKDVRTVSTSEYSGSIPVIGYLNDSITCQQTTSNLMKHTFTDELELLGIQTLLAYNNGYYRMANAFYPKSEKDEWQNSSREVFSNLTTYNNPFQAEDCLTVTESDARIRAYFQLQYDVSRSGNVITLQSNCGEIKDSCYFILRTHDEEIASVSGGTCKEIEKNAYLITADREKTEIKLTSSLSDLVNMEGSNR